MPGWEAFFTAQVAASATLAGLMFVGVSLNLTKILSNPSLPNRALAGFYLLMAILILSSLQLVPDQTFALRGAEILVVGLATWFAGSRLDLASVRQSEAEFRKHFIRHSILFQIAVFPYVIGDGPALRFLLGCRGHRAVAVLDLFRGLGLAGRNQPLSRQGRLPGRLQ